MVDYFDYKELLKRARSQLPEVVFSDVRFEIPSRITSYNVCYTKLLREEGRTFDIINDFKLTSR